MAAAVCAAPACANVRQSSNAGHQNVSGINFSAGSARPGALSERARRVAARRAAVTQAVLTPPVGHEEVRPSTILRPVSAAAVDSSKALEQFRSMGGASREFHLSHAISSF
jgi:hypothetical protein